ncbi:MAG: FkbM family methyltransferase, partial [Pirellulales bacterium]|nr:FkbM family methyltransferase [Pirellulales bacterium]
WCGVPLSPVRRTCATLAREALRRALAGPPSVSEPLEPKPIPPLRLVLLDRDDTLIRLPAGRRYVAGEDPFELAPGAGAFMALMNGLSVNVAVVTNQQGVSLDEHPEITLEAVQRLHDRLQEALQPYGAHVDRFYVCPHAASAECGCRKPRPGLVRQALWDFGVAPSQAALIGDRERDLRAGAAAGLPTRILLCPEPARAGPSETLPAGTIAVATFAECGERIAAGLVNPVRDRTAVSEPVGSDVTPPLIRRFLSRLPGGLPEDPVILDVGSCTGAQAGEFAQVFPQARVYAFEPHPVSAAVCRTNTSRFPNVSVVEAAVGETDGRVELQAVLDGNPGASSLFVASGHQDVQPLEQSPIEVRALRLDTWAAREGIERCDLVWMDLQGAELLALRGMGALLSTVRAIQVEITYRELYRGQVLWPELRSFLESRGLTLVDEWPDPCGYFGDAVFVRKMPD